MNLRCSYLRPRILSLRIARNKNILQAVTVAFNWVYIIKSGVLCTFKILRPFQGGKIEHSSHTFECIDFLLRSYACELVLVSSILSAPRTHVLPLTRVRVIFAFNFPSRVCGLLLACRRLTLLWVMDVPAFQFCRWYAYKWIRADLQGARTRACYRLVIYKSLVRLCALPKDWVVSTCFGPVLPRSFVHANECRASSFPLCVSRLTSDRRLRSFG